MSRFFKAYIEWVRRILPTPLSIAFLLTIITVCAIALYGDINENRFDFIGRVWSDGLWQPNLLVFAVQMMLILVLGHILALSPIVAKLINLIVKPCTTTARAAALVSFFTILVGLFNWGLGLIFGAILARKVGEKAHAEKREINYPLIGAAGYTGMLVWHGGFSGSSLIKVAEKGHLSELMGTGFTGEIPQLITLNQTMFSSMNIAASLALILLIPFFLFLIASFSKTSHIAIKPHVFDHPQTDELIGAERLDHSAYFIKGIGAIIVLYCFKLMYLDLGFLNYFNPNNINLLLLGLALFFHRSISSFSNALDQAIQGASGILIQFPLYFGILALMNESGLVSRLAAWFIEHSSVISYPVYTFISAGLVNLFVPSGGGQWAIQGPIIIQSSLELGIPLHKSILAMAYGDEVTNMLQPFWALPLLGITRLKARDILPYTLLLFLAGSIVFLSCLLIF
ncbi:MAG: TIGR00366 family protein [Salibacteraceae bacterium]